MSSTTTSKYETLAQEILQHVGGPANVASVTHCATRLRFVLADVSKANKEAVVATRGVITVVDNNGQFQVVIGNTVNKVYAALTELGIDAKGAEDENANAGSFVSRAIGLITSIFTPFLWVLGSVALIRGLIIILERTVDGFAATTTRAIMFGAADAFMTFLPFGIAITAAKRFKANVYTSVAIVGAMLFTSLVPVIAAADGSGQMTLLAFSRAGNDVTFLGLPVTMVSYTTAILPTIVAVYFQSKIEKLWTRVLPEMVQSVIVPALTILVCVPVTLMAIGPVTSFLANGAGDGIAWLLDTQPIIAGILLGAGWQVAVIFGIHWGIVPIGMNMLSTHGYNLITGSTFPSVMAQAGAMLGVIIRTKSRELRTLSIPAFFTALFFGITEPGIYGVNLRLKKPFVFGVIGGGIGGAIAALGRTGVSAPGMPSLLSLPNAIGVGSFIHLVIGITVAFFVAMILTLIFGFKDLPDAVPAADADTAVATDDVAAIAAAEVVAEAEAIAFAPCSAEVLSPLVGEVVNLAEVPDQVFASGALGNGVAIIPSVGKLVAPFDGEVAGVFPTGHAIGLVHPSGMEMLVHIGIDTVKLAGKHYQVHVTEGQQVKAGETLITFDIAGIAAAGYELITPVLVSNSDEFPGFHDAAYGPIGHGEPLFIARRSVEVSDLELATA